MKEFSSRLFIDTMLPYVKTAGKYALKIQDAAVSCPAKEGMANRFSQALTDADISIQTYIEVALLAHFPELSFFGEEEKTSINMKYFPKSAEYRVLLDPIDGTCWYKDGQDNFSIILSLTSAQGYEAGIICMPGLDMVFCFDKQRGPLEEKDGKLQAYRIETNSRTIVTINLPEHIPALRRKFTVIDILENYDRERACPNVNSIFYSAAACFLGTNNSSIDWGVQAALVEASGGRVSDFKGDKLQFRFQEPGFLYDNIVVSATEAIHAEVLPCLNK